jgi:prolipoprotein diacylglyceryltransferase
LALPVLGLSALGWVGCVAASCAAGKDVPPGSFPLLVNWPDLYGVILPRWPTQLMGIFFSLLAFGVLFAQRNAKWPGGLRGALALTLLALITFIVSLFRGDDMPLLASWRLDTVTDVIALGLGLIAMVAAWALEPSKPKAVVAPAPEPVETVEPK